MSATLLQQFGGQAFAASLQTTVSIPSGRNVIVMAAHQGISDPVITDSAGGTWTKIGSTADAGTPATAQRLSSMWHRFGISSALTWIKVASSTSTSSAAYELTIIDVSNISAVRSSSVANITSGSVTTPISAVSGDFLLSAISYTAGSRAEVAPTGFTDLTDQTTSTTYQASAYQAASTSSGTISPIWTGLSASTGIITAAFTTDVSGALVVSAALTPTTVPGTDRGQERTLQLNCSGGNGNPITFGPIDWGDGLTPDAAITKAAGVNTATFKRTPTVVNDRATGGSGKTLAWTVTQAQ